MKEYAKRGYLNSDFRLFHLKDMEKHDFEYHYHDFDKIIIFIRGSVDYLIEGRSYHLQPYDIVLVGQGDIHKPVIRKEEPYERIVVYLSQSFIASYSGEDYDLNRCFLMSKKQHSHVLRMHTHKKSMLLNTITNLEHAFQDEGYASGLYRKVLFLEFMIHLNRAVNRNRLEYLDTAPLDPKIAEILEYIGQHLTEPLRIDTISEQFYTSRYHLMRQFKETTGYTIGSYITYKRLLYARELMHTGKPITQICFDCGFHDYSSFSRAYKKFFEETPRETLKDLCKIKK